MDIFTIIDFYLQKNLVFNFIFNYLNKKYIRREIGQDHVKHARNLVELKLKQTSSFINLYVFLNSTVIYKIL